MGEKWPPNQIGPESFFIFLFFYGREEFFFIDNIDKRLGMGKEGVWRQDLQH